MDIQAGICTCHEVKSLFLRHLKTDTACYAQSCHKLVDVSRAVWRTHLEGLLVRSVRNDILLRRLIGLFHRICHCTHVNACRPSERNAHESRTVAVTPTDIGRSLLVRNETEE